MHHLGREISFCKLQSYTQNSSQDWTTSWQADIDISLRPISYSSTTVDIQLLFFWKIQGIAKYVGKYATPPMDQMTQLAIKKPLIYIYLLNTGISHIANLGWFYMVPTKPSPKKKGKFQEFHSIGNAWNRMTSGRNSPETCQPSWDD